MKNTSEGNIHFFRIFDEFGDQNELSFTSAPVSESVMPRLCCMGVLR